ncbi:hypothetical protein AQPE_3085 [Aquipluma nitroreducens]|uniref:Uncharacterized protein n=1 Tax=Aquipluma nitroreducens TaxID=2010828 RepID=A0A5K7SBP9_9BACT|nr:hypothetical protein AQPE_3085 [Aquipluma nitroreducens]
MCHNDVYAAKTGQPSKFKKNYPHYIYYCQNCRLSTKNMSSQNLIPTEITII